MQSCLATSKGDSTVALCATIVILISRRRGVGGGESRLLLTSLMAAMELAAADVCHIVVRFSLTMVGKFAPCKRASLFMAALPRIPGHVAWGLEQDRVQQPTTYLSAAASRKN